VKRFRKTVVFLAVIASLMMGITMTATAGTPKFNKTSVSVKKKKKVKLSMKSLSKKQKKKKWSFSTSDKSVATVKRSGKTACKVTGKKDGYAVIRAKQGKVVAYALVKVGKGNKNPSGTTKAWAEKAGKKIPGVSTKKNSGSISDNSDNDNTNIVGGDDSQNNDTIVLPWSVSVSPLFPEVEEEKTVSLSASVYPDNTTDKTITWSSENTSIATVNSNGVVTGINEGEVKIYAKCGNVTGYSRVTVNARKPVENRDYKVTNKEIQFYEYDNKQYYSAIYEITNIGNKNLKLDSAQYDIYSTSGRLMDSEDWVSCDPDVIKPGEKGYVWNNFKSTDLSVGSYEIKPIFKFERTSKEVHYYPISNLSIREDQYSKVKIVGNFTNDTSEEVSMLYIVFLHYNNAGKVIAVHGTNIMDVAPGATQGFETSGLYLADYLTYNDLKNFRVIAASSVY